MKYLTSVYPIRIYIKELIAVAATQLPFSEVQEFPCVDYERQEENFVNPPTHYTHQLTGAVGYLKLLTSPASGKDHLGSEMMIWLAVGTPEGSG